MAAALRRSGALERAVGQVNRIGGLPTDLRVTVMSCHDGTGYDAHDKQVEFCVEDYVAAQRAVAHAGEPDPMATVVQIAEATLLHELAHALIDVRRLPVTGREEDAADQFMVWQAVRGVHDPGLVLSSALEYELDEARYEQSDDDEHGRDGQRAVNLLCWLHGSAPKRWSRLVDGEPLTEYRAAQCAAEWRSLAYAWRSLLAEPHTAVG